MLKEIIINSSADQTRVAIIEDGSLVDFFVDYPEKRRMVGDIYFGKVARVLPGIKAAFIDIGMEHDAFLHFSDIGDRTSDLQAILDDDAEIEDESDETPASPAPAPKKQQVELINGIPKLKKGQPILVQISKEPVANKGVRITSSISIAGRFCVLLPYDKKIGISKKIYDYKERRRLRSIARSIIPPNYGLIIRTVARNQNENALKQDLLNLKQTWEDLEEAVKKETPPALVHQDLGTTISVIRDLFTSDVHKIYVDSKKLWKQIRDYISVVHPDQIDRIELFKQSGSIFESFRIEEQIRSLLGRKIPMKSGGYLIIDHTEAMVVIDVNSGKYAANKEQELNSLRTDLEAAREIARQLRLRDIGGLIVIDFIDLEEDKNRKKIYDELKKEFRKDRAKVSVLPMSDFGLVEITRQRIRQNIHQALTENCPYCQGRGVINKSSHFMYDIEEWIRRNRNNHGDRSVVLKCNPLSAMKLREGFFTKMNTLRLKYFMFIKLVDDETLGMDQFKFISKKSGEDITDQVFQ